jgi:hypothetical protein
MSLFGILIAAAIAAHPVPAPDRAGFSTIENAVVVAQSPRPGIMSGVLAVWADFDVEVSGGPRQRMYQIYQAPDQFIPPVNSICRIVIDRASIDGVSSDGALDGRGVHNRVVELVCDTGRWSSTGLRAN